MWRTLAVCALLLVPSPPLRAADPPQEKVIRITAQPMAAPKPALKYQLLPELREMNPGNPIQAYYKCFAEQHNFWRSKEPVANREKWQKMPLKELPLEEIHKSGQIRGNPLRYADHAARLDTPDWQILLQFKQAGPLFLLPDIQQLRELAGALKVRFRVEVAERRFDDAIATAKTMLALSRHLGEHPTMIGELVGLSAANLALDPLDDMIGQPGCPNLYWALTDLPQPFIDLRKGIQGDRMMMNEVFALIDEQRPMSETQIQQAVDRLSRLVREANVLSDVSVWLKELTEAEDHIHDGRKRLIEAGLDEARVKRFPPAQVVLLEEKLEFSVHRDEARKAMALPYWQAKPILAALQPRKERPDAPLRWLAEMNYLTLKQAQARLDQRIALLRCVEALRMYAAEHEGKLPAKLDDIKLPLPVDPATGKPFRYKIEGKTAHLLGAPLLFEGKTAHLLGSPFLRVQMRYEVTIEK